MEGTGCEVVSRMACGVSWGLQESCRVTVSEALVRNQTPEPAVSVVPAAAKSTTSGQCRRHSQAYAVPQTAGCGPRDRRTRDGIATSTVYVARHRFIQRHLTATGYAHRFACTSSSLRVQLRRPNGHLFYTITRPPSTRVASSLVRPTQRCSGTVVELLAVCYHAMTAMSVYV